MKKLTIVFKYNNNREYKDQQTEKNIYNQHRMEYDNISNQSYQTQFQSNQQIESQSKIGMKTQKLIDMSYDIIKNQFEEIRDNAELQRQNNYSYQQFYNYEIQKIQQQEHQEKQDQKQNLNKPQQLDDQPVKKQKISNSDYQSTYQKNKKKQTDQSNKPQIIQNKCSVQGIIAINDEKIIYHTNQSIIIHKNTFRQEYEKKEIGCSSPVIGLQVNKAGQIIAQTKTHVILLSEDLKVLDQFKDNVEKDLLTFTQENFQNKGIVYYSNKKKLLLIRKITQFDKKFEKSSILLDTENLISIKILQNNNLFLGFKNGQIQEYSFDKKMIVNNYTINSDNIYQQIFSSIQFNETYCLGIIQNKIFKLDYYSKKSEIFLTATQNIRECSYYHNQQKREYIINALLENDKIYKSVKINGIQDYGNERSLKQKVTSITFLSKTSQFIYGCQNGNIHAYAVRLK